MLLILDTSLAAGSMVALVSADGGTLLGEAVYPRAEGGSSHLLTGAQGLLEAAGGGLDTITGLVISRGPGSYTGLRIGFGLAQGLSESRRIPAAAVPSYEAFARRYRESLAPLVVCYDARSRGLAFVAYLEGEEVPMCGTPGQALPPLAAAVKDRLELGEDRVLVSMAPAAALPGLIPRPCRLVGPGVAVLVAQLGEDLPGDLEAAVGSDRPGALSLAGLALERLAAGGDDLERIEPYYLGTLPAPPRAAR